MQCTHPRACVTGRGWAGLCTVYYLSYVKTNYLLTAGEILFITQDALRQCPCPCSALTVHGNMQQYVSICIQNASDFISAQFVTLLLESEKNKYWRIEVLKYMHQNQNILTAMIMFSLDLN